MLYLQPASIFGSGITRCWVQNYLRNINYTECPSTATLKNIIYTLLTYSMVQSPSWEADWFAASQEISRISRNPKVH